MKTIRASEIGSFLYCRRSWWYARQGYASENVRELAAGLELHEQHSRSVFASGCLRALAFAALLAALALLAIYLTGLWV
jgi:hypothetical protein